LFARIPRPAPFQTHFPAENVTDSRILVNPYRLNSCVFNAARSYLNRHSAPKTQAWQLGRSTKNDGSAIAFHNRAGIFIGQHPGIARNNLLEKRSSAPSFRHKIYPADENATPSAPSPPERPLQPAARHRPELSPSVIFSGRRIFYGRSISNRVDSQAASNPKTSIPQTSTSRR
jgi:hypothetical protein